MTAAFSLGGKRGPVFRAAPGILTAGMAAAGGVVDSSTSARIKHLRDDDFETYEAGQSDGQSAGNVIVGWGSVVRAQVARLASPQRPRATP